MAGKHAVADDRERLGRCTDDRTLVIQGDLVLEAAGRRVRVVLHAHEIDGRHWDRITRLPDCLRS